MDWRVAGLVLGIIGVFVGLIPILAVPALICGILALIFGITGRRKAIREPMAGRKKMGTAAAILGVVAIALSIAGFVTVNSAVNHLNTSLNQTFSPTEGNGANNSPSAHGPTFANGVLTTPDLKIQITRYKVIKAGQKGNEYGKKPVIAFWYKTTNLSGAKVDPMLAFIPQFNAYQDNNPNAENELDVGSLPDERFLDSQSENIKKGGTVEDAIAYELDDLHTPVDLVATEGLDEVIGKATYNLR